MPAQTFTAQWLKGLKPPTDKARIDYYDTSRLSKGQALVLINYRSGRKKWAVSYYKAGKSQPLLRIGEYAEKPNKQAGIFGLKDADEEAQRQLTLLLDNVDPAEVRRELAGVPAFEIVAELFLLRYAVKLTDGGRRYREIIERDFIPAWEHRKARDIVRADVRTALDAVAARGPVAANRALACIRKLFNWALEEEQGGLEYNPAMKIKAPGGEERPSERALDHPKVTGEIKALWTALDTAKMAPALKLMLQLVLVTGQRTQELRFASKGEFDLVNKRWIIPAVHTKSKKADHLVTLSPLAVRLVKQAFKLSPDSDLLLPSPRTGKVFEQNALPRAVRNNDWPLGHFSPHDLRRTAATHMRRIGVPRTDVKAVLNHRPGDVTAVYDVYDMIDEKQAALNKWGRELGRLTK